MGVEPADLPTELANSLSGMSGSISLISSSWKEQLDGGVEVAEAPVGVVDVVGSFLPRGDIRCTALGFAPPARSRPTSVLCRFERCPVGWFPAELADISASTPSFFSRRWDAPAGMAALLLPLGAATVTGSGGRERVKAEEEPGAALRFGSKIRSEE